MVGPTSGAGPGGRGGTRRSDLGGEPGGGRWGWELRSPDAEECGAAEAALSAPYAPGAGPQGKCGEGSWCLVGQVGRPRGYAPAGVVWSTGPGALNARSRRGRRGRAAPRHKAPREGDTGSCSRLAMLVLGISYWTEIYVALSTPNLERPQVLYRFYIL